MQIVERTVEVDAPLESVFELLSDFESYPLWMRAVGDVRRTGRRTTLWRADAPAGGRVEWEAETVVFEPDRRIVWRSVGGDVETEGEVVLSETDRGTTLLRLVLGYGAPDARAALLVGRHPARQLDEDLARFARLAERRARDEREGPAGRERERRNDGERSERGEPRGLSARDEYERRGGGRGVIWGDARGRGYRDEEGTRRFERGERGGRFERREREGRFAENEREAREARHEEALRETHRRQAEHLRRYREERERGRLPRGRTRGDGGERGRRA